MRNRNNTVAASAMAALAITGAAALVPRSALPMHMHMHMHVDEARLAEIETVRSALAPPRPARADEFRATVVIAACTGTRVGPRHYLTAAHCVIDPATRKLKDWLSPPYPITLTNRLDTAHPSPDDVEAQVGIQAVHVHPRYRWDVQQSFSDEDYRPDVAVMIVDREIDGIPIMPVGAWRVETSQSLMLVGTRPPVIEPADAAPTERRIKLIPARAVDTDPFYGFDAGALDRAFFLTVGPAAKNREYAIGFGDSGGAAYDIVEGQSFIVGVHAVIFSTTTGHTRLDTMSGIASWLEGLGVWVVHDRKLSKGGAPL